MGSVRGDAARLFTAEDAENGRRERGEMQGSFLLSFGSLAASELSRDPQETVELRSMDSRGGCPHIHSLTSILYLFFSKLNFFILPLRPGRLD
jgi:hypothetical protein